jgi:hypothetical protein
VYSFPEFSSQYRVLSVNRFCGIRERQEDKSPTTSVAPSPVRRIGTYDPHIKLIRHANHDGITTFNLAMQHEGLTIAISTGH